MPPHRHIVGNLNEIINFCTFANPGAPKTGTINRGIGSYLDIVVHLDNPNLGNFDVPPVFVFETKTVAPKDNSRVQNDAIPNHTPLPHNDARVQKTVGPQRGTMPEVAVRSNDTPLSHPDARFENCVRLYGDILPQGYSLR